VERHRERRDVSTKSFSFEHALPCARLAPHRGKQCLPDAIALKRAALRAMFIAKFVTDSQCKCKRHGRAARVGEEAFEEYFPVIGHFSRVIFYRGPETRAERMEKNRMTIWGNHLLRGHSCSPLDATPRTQT
jgi:hypothetical protein